MEVIKALPQDKFAASLAVSNSPDFERKVNEAVALIRYAVYEAKGINRNVKPIINSGYGKDGCTVVGLARKAGVLKDIQISSVINGGDLPVHETFFSEFDKALGKHFHVYHRSRARYVEILREAIQWGRKNKLTKKNGSEIDFWDSSPVDSWVNEEVSDFAISRDFVEPEQLFFFGHKPSEEMWKHDEFQRRDFKPLLRVVDPKGQNLPYWDCEPLVGWRDVDVWAFLIKENLPCSPIYSYHQVSQRGGRNSFPRTLWYPSSALMNAQFYRWLHRYAPALLTELVNFFPEIEERLKKK